VFGSDYRTPAGHVAPQSSAQHLLEGGPAAVAIAPANYRSRREADIRTIGVLAEDGDSAPLQTAHDLADRLGAELTSAEIGVDLLVVGSRREAPEGRVLITARTSAAIENATAPVLVLARGVSLRFGAGTHTAAAA
jgi:nucleotide-binding universal stress UspA family protein